MAREIESIRKRLLVLRERDPSDLTDEECWAILEELDYWISRQRPVMHRLYFLGEHHKNLRREI